MAEPTDLERLGMWLHRIWQTLVWGLLILAVILWRVW
jgi:hypothetical protein